MNIKEEPKNIHIFYTHIYVYVYVYMYISLYYLSVLCYIYLPTYISMKRIKSKEEDTKIMKQKNYKILVQENFL